MALKFSSQNNTIVCTKTVLKKHFQYDFIRQLAFKNYSHKKTIQHKIQKSDALPNALKYGKRYAQEIAIGHIPPVTIKWASEAVGFGLFTDVDIPKGTFVAEYMGLIRENNEHHRMNNYLYCYPVKDDIGRDFVIDAELMSNHSRFINHSFKPNLGKIYALHEDGLYHALLIANKTIPAKSQLFFDYGETYWYLRGKPAFC